MAREPTPSLSNVPSPHLHSPLEDTEKLTSQHSARPVPNAESQDIRLSQTRRGNTLGRVSKRQARDSTLRDDAEDCWSAGRALKRSSL